MSLPCISQLGLFSGSKCLPLYVFREQEEGEPAAAGENAGSAEASNTKTTLPGTFLNSFIKLIKGHPYWW